MEISLTVASKIGLYNYYFFFLFFFAGGGGGGKGFGGGAGRNAQAPDGARHWADGPQACRRCCGTRASGFS